MLSIVVGLSDVGVAVIIIARRVNFTERITSQMIFVTSNVVIRRNAPRRFFSGPAGRQAGTFLNGVLEWPVFSRCGVVKKVKCRGRGSVNFIVFVNYVILKYLQ